MNHTTHALIPYEEVSLAGQLVEVSGTDEHDLLDLIADALDCDALLDCYEEGSRGGDCD